MERFLGMTAAGALALFAGQAMAQEGALFVVSDLTQSPDEAVAAIRDHADSNDDWLHLAESGRVGGKVTGPMCIGRSAAGLGLVPAYGLPATAADRGPYRRARPGLCWRPGWPPSRRAMIPTPPSCRASPPDTATTNSRRSPRTSGAGGGSHRALPAS